MRGSLRRFQDIHKAGEILDGCLCIKGDVPATLLALGEPEELYEYASRLVRDIGSDGGFILSLGCEVPLNARTENVMALMKAGHYFRFSRSPEYTTSSHFI